MDKHIITDAERTTIQARLRMYAQQYRDSAFDIDRMEVESRLTEFLAEAVHHTQNEDELAMGFRKYYEDRRGDYQI